MNEQIPVVARCRINGITMEVCHGEIPDAYRLLRFDPITELELPDTKASDEEFDDWLEVYRRSTTEFEKFFLFLEACGRERKHNATSILSRPKTT